VTLTMSLLIFIPGKHGADLKHLVDVGLGDLLRLEAGDRGPNGSDLLSAGPGGNRGVVFSFSGSVVPGYAAEKQTWQPAKPGWMPSPKPSPSGRGQGEGAGAPLPAGRFWFGWPQDSPPRPADLVRDPKATLDGYLVQLADGNSWAIPNGMLLPCRFALDEAGDPQKVPCREVAAIHARTLWAFQAIQRQIETNEPPPWRESLEYAAEMLSLNYRLNLELALALGLFDERNLGNILKASTDLDQLIAISQKKRAAAAETSAG
jgi:hypothetical protein